MKFVRLVRVYTGSDPKSKLSRKFDNDTSTVASMLSRSVTRALSSQSRLFSSSSARQTKVAVLGAGGGIGQPLSLLLKSDPLVTSLSLYDIRGAPGVAADVSHVDTASEVGFYALLSLHVAIQTYS